MLRMPPFEMHLPTTPEQAVAAMASLPRAMYVAGGTDLLPNLKHELHRPDHLVSLSHVEGMGEIALDKDGTLRIGAAATLHAVATSAIVAVELPALSRAASLVAGPQHRRMGTIGGNVLLDTRCLFYNQTRAWRTALGSCLKAEGSWCHVIGSDRACVAAQSSDTVPVLVAADAAVEARLPGRDAPEIVPLRSLWTKDGRFDANRTLPGSALVTAILVPQRPQGAAGTYRKVRSRAAVDYPQLGIAALAAFDGERVASVEVVIGAMLPFPKRVAGLDAFAGEALTDEVIDAIADRVFKSARPQAQIWGAPEWRRHMARVETRRALIELRPAPR